MLHEKLLVKNKLGLHTRAAARLVDLAKKFESKIELAFNDRMVDCKSIMGVITLGAYHDSIVQITLSGEDEKEAFSAIQKLFEDKFGEN